MFPNRLECNFRWYAIRAVSTQSAVIITSPGENRKTTLETSGENAKLHSKRVEKCEITLETSEEDMKFHSKRLEKM